MVNNPTAMQVTPVDPRVWKIPWRREWLPVQYSCLENSMDREAWWTIVQGITKKLSH